VEKFLQKAQHYNRSVLQYSPSVWDWELMLQTAARGNWKFVN